MVINFKMKTISKTFKIQIIKLNGNWFALSIEIDGHFRKSMKQ